MGDAMKFVKSLYVQILFAVLLGVLVGHFWSQQAIALKPLGDAFIKLIKMMIAPVVFCTIVTGIAGMSDKRSLGRLLSKTLLLFLGLTVISLIIGLVAVYLFKPGVGMNISTVHTDFMVGGPELEIDGLTKDGKSVPILREDAWQLPE